MGIFILPRLKFDLYDQTKDFFVLEFAYQYTRYADDVAAFEVYAFDAAGRVRRIERHKLEPVLAVHIVDALDVISSSP